MFTILILALLLSCIVTYTNSQLPTTQEQREASGVNSFKRLGSSRQTSDNNNALPSPTQRQPTSSDSSPVERSPSYINYNHNNNNYGNGIQYAARPSLRERLSPQDEFLSRTLPNRPQLFIFPGQRFPQTIASRPTSDSNGLSYQPQLQPQYRPPSVPPKSSTVYAPVTQFAWQLFRYANPEGQNYVSCPLSPQLLLSYVLSGSVGETLQELRNVVGYENPEPLTQLINSMLTSGDNRQLQIATSFFVSDRLELNPGFKNLANANNVEIIRTDFYNPNGFSREYNRWVRSKTKGTLGQTHANAPAQTKMIMSSAVYFKGDWIYKFNSAENGVFYHSPGYSMPTQMMTLSKKLQYGQIDNMAEWVSIPYNSSDSMIVILPKQGYRVDDVIRDLRINDLFDALNQDTYANVNLTLPKFKIETKSSLIEPLQKMGCNRIFSPNSQVTKLTENGEPMQISNALQQASMEVNEEGSIASSLTSFSVVALSFSPPTPDIEFTVDRPFIAIIADRRNNIPYFITKVVKPQ